MKNLFRACLLALLVLGAGCATEVRPPPVILTGDIMVDGPEAIAHGPRRDRVLWEYRTGVAYLRAGEDEKAKGMFDDALLALGGVYGKDKDAKKSRSYFSSESRKTFIGEPYERVMAYYYRGILYWKDGEPDNARACFRTAQLEDSSTEEQFGSDYVLLDYLDGLASTKLREDGSNEFQRAEKEARQSAKPPPYNAQANVLFFVDYGPPVKKYAAGPYHEELHFEVPISAVKSARVTVGGQTVALAPYDDLGFQATTRGGRVMDHILANKAVFKSTTDVVGTGAIIGGAVAATSRNQTSQEVGLGLIAAGLISKIVSASTTPAADTRCWDNLPKYLSFASMQLPPGPATAIVEFLDAGGQPMANLTKTVNLNVSADKHDEVVYVSDHSPTQTTQ